MIYLWATVLLAANTLGWASNFFGLPGNWLLLFFSFVYYIVLPEGSSPSLGATVLILALILAIAGELWEFGAGAFGAAKKGGSRRGIVYSVLFSFIGSIGGAIIGAPIIPVVGPVIGALLGGAGGAFVGAYLGERKQPMQDRLAVGKAAMVGKLFGTVGKLAFGLVMFIILTIDSFT